MNTMKHTQGPWTASQDDANGLSRYLVASGGRNFGHFEGWADDGITTPKENRANVRLIAAAPELLEACKVLMKAWDDGEEGNEVEWEGLVEAVNLAREAIKKAGVK